jgi:HSP20 family molecular chaperone IbpA
MNSEEVIPVRLRVGETMADEIQEMYDEITRRAYEIFQQRRGDGTLDLEDWLTAEREVVDKPRVRVEEAGPHIIITVYVAHLIASDVRLLVTPDAMLIHGPVGNGLKRLFRVVQFPRRVDVTKAEAQYGEGCLVLTA